MTTVDATPDLVPAFLARIEPARRARIEAMPGNGPGWLERSIEQSDLTWCGVDAGGPVNMGGVLRIGHPAAGYVWQVITPHVALHKRAYLLQGPPLIERALTWHRCLMTIIEATYTAALRHVRRTGWTISPPVPINGLLSCYCERTRHV